MRREHIVDGWWEMPGQPVPARGWPGTKNSQTHRIWLPAPAQALLAELDDKAREGFVFAGPGGRPLGGLDAAMRAICAKLKVEQFTSESAFNVLRNFNRMLTEFIIEVVEFNIDETEALGGDPSRMNEARSRIARAGQAIVNGDLAKAADHAQRAYDLISREANSAPECLVGRL